MSCLRDFSLAKSQSFFEVFACFVKSTLKSPNIIKSLAWGIRVNVSWSVFIQLSIDPTGGLYIIPRVMGLECLNCILIQQFSISTSNPFVRLHGQRGAPSPGAGAARIVLRPCHSEL